MESEHLARNVLLGTAVGDAYGLKGEGLPRRAAQTVDWTRGPLFGRAVLSDDTEQSFLVAQSLLRADGDIGRFRRLLRWRLIGWLFAGPPGVGLGTARSILKLTVGFSSGVRTAGNGSAMRSPIIGAAVPHDIERLERLVRASSELTHNDGRAFVGSFAVALAAGAGARGEGLDEVLARVEPFAERAESAEQWGSAVAALRTSLEQGEGVVDYAASIGCADGVTGYVYHTVPVALFAWARYDDPERALAEVWSCGGDTDSVGAIAGALAFAKAGVSPASRWLDGISDFPLSVGRLEAVAAALAAGGRPVRWAWFAMPLRNLFVFPFILLYALFVMLPKKYFAGRSRD